MEIWGESTSFDFKEIQQVSFLILKMAFSVRNQSPDATWKKQSSVSIQLPATATKFLTSVVEHTFDLQTEYSKFRFVLKWKVSQHKSKIL